MSSRFAEIMNQTAVPAMMRVFGVAAIHTNSDSDVVLISAIIEYESVEIGEFSERIENQWTATVAKSTGVTINDTLTVEADEWRITQLITDDGYMLKFAIRRAV